MYWAVVGDRAVAGGWIARTQTLLSGSVESAELGWVALNIGMFEDNRDRKAVYREIAVANGHAEWEEQIRETFAKQWIASAHAGWAYQAADGSWKQK